MLVFPNVSALQKAVPFMAGPAGVRHAVLSANLVLVADLALGGMLDASLWPLTFLELGTLRLSTAVGLGWLVFLLANLSVPWLLRFVYTAVCAVGGWFLFTCLPPVAEFLRLGTRWDRTPEQMEFIKRHYTKPRELLARGLRENNAALLAHHAQHKEARAVTSWSRDQLLFLPVLWLVDLASAPGGAGLALTFWSFLGQLPWRLDMVLQALVVVHLLLAGYVGLSDEEPEAELVFTGAEDAGVQVTREAVRPRPGGL